MKLDLPAPWLAQILALLRSNVRGHEVWAFGSRIKGTHHEASDLDLVLRNAAEPDSPFEGLGRLQSQFQESSLPIRVDLLDWAVLPTSMRREIEKDWMQIWPDAL